MSDAASTLPRIDPRAVEYPSSDGRPVAETPLHYDRLRDVATALQLRYAGRGDVYVGVNMLVYDVPNEPKSHLAPDVFVVFGVPNHRRDVFKLWEERPPAVILEITSKSTSDKDTGEKRQRYAAWGVGEYFLYDPRAEYLSPPLRGLSLEGGAYREMPERVLANGARGLFSDALGLHLWLREGELRLYDPATGADLPTPAEQAAQARTEARARVRAEARADTEAARADRAEARIQELEARLHRRMEP